MKEAQCPVCSIQGAPFLQAHDYNRRISGEVFQYNKCPSCGLIYLVNVPEDLGKYYPVDYYTIPKDRESLLTNNHQEQHKIEFIKQFINKGKLLEIGPSWGAFASLAYQEGFDVDVIEMDKQCCDFIQSQLSEIRVIQSNNPAEVLKNLSQYDVIVLWQVIEHLLDPWETLKAAVEKLLPGGILVISTPNPASFQFRVLGRFWTHLDAPRHLELISIRLLEKQALSLGLQKMLLTTKDKGACILNTAGWIGSLNNLCNHYLNKSITCYIARVISFILRPVERSNLLGSAYTVVLQKDRMGSDSHVPSADSMPLLSIGMPVYNGAKHVRRAVDSLIAQTFTNFELIISDNASTDATEEICQECASRDKRIRYIRHPVNRGAPFNFHFVLKESKGTYFMWAAHDDERFPQHIEKLIHIHRCGHYLLVASQCTMLDQDGNEIPIKPMSPELYRGTSWLSFKNFMLLHHFAYAKSNMFYGIFLRNALIDKPIFTDVHPDIGWDHTLVMRIIAQGPVCYLPETTWIKNVRPPKPIAYHLFPLSVKSLFGGLKPKIYLRVMRYQQGRL